MARRRFSTFAAAIGLFSCLLSSAALARGLIRDVELEQLVREYTDPILEVAGLEPSAVDIYLIGDPSLNAFVAGGQNIFVHTGLLTETKTPDQVIGVMAHEVGHITGGHLARSDEAIAAATRPMLLTLGLGIAAIAAGAPDAGIAIIAGGQTVAQANFLKYSRIQEAAADQAALTFLEASGQSGWGLYKTFDQLARREAFARADRFEYLRTHPLSSQRLQSMLLRVEQSPYRDFGPSEEDQFRFEMAQAKIRGFLSAPETTFRIYREEDQSLPAKYARAIAHYQTPNIDQALTDVDALLAEDPDNPYFHELKGQMLFEFGQVADAIAPHQRSIDLAPDKALLRINLARAMLATEDDVHLEPALKELKLAVRMEPGNGFAWSEMAKAYDRLGDQGMAMLATAERFYSIGARREALQFAQRAKANLDREAPAYRQALDIIAATAPEQGGQRRRSPSFALQLSEAQDTP